MYESQLYRMKPSDRRILTEAMQSEEGCDQLYEDIVEYMRIWEVADWLDDYEIEWKARWFKNTAPAALLERLHFFAEDSNHPARLAFRKGLAL